MLNIENKLTLAQEETALKNYESAIEYIDEILEKYPSHKDALWQRVYIPYQYYINIVSVDFRIDKEIAMSEDYEIDYGLTPNAAKIGELRTQCLHYFKTLFQVSGERERNELFERMEKNRMMRLIRNDFNFLLELDRLVLGGNASVNKLILEYCNRIYLGDLKRGFEIPQSIIDMKKNAESILRRLDMEMFLITNELFEERKTAIQKYLREEKELKQKRKTQSEKPAKFRINPVYIFVSAIVLIIIMFFILLQILGKYT
jgi:hypothetical protein